MRFGMLGIDYHASSLDDRALASFTDTTKLAIYVALFQQGITQVVILATCNRSEIYYFFEERAQCEMVKTCFLTHSNEALQPLLYQKVDEEAMVYLMEVCGGYHSMVMGEDQIFHQMQSAYTFAQKAQACGKQMHKIMQNCFAYIKKIKTVYRMSEVSISLAALTIQQLHKYDIELRRVMIIGNGDMALSLLPYLKKECQRITLCTRSKQKVQHWLTAYDCDWIAFDDRYYVLSDYDVILSATSSPHPIITAKRYPTTHHKQVFIDFASPRDIVLPVSDDRIYIDLDQMQTFVDMHKAERKRRLDKAHKALYEYAHTLYCWLQNSKMDPYIKDIQQQSIQMAQDTYQLLQQKLNLQIHEEHTLQKILETSFTRLASDWILLFKQDIEDKDMFLHLQKEEAK